jgi:hypothetical protein
VARFDRATMVAKYAALYQTLLTERL